jgi:hypothetical protein
VRWRTEWAANCAHIAALCSALCGCIGFTEIAAMLQTIAIILLVLWVLGLVSSYTMGGLIHILLVVAIVMILVRFIQGRRVL